MKNPRHHSALLLVGALAAGCASAPRDIPELDSARRAVQQAQAEPLVQEAAGVQLKKAQEALQKAEQSASGHKPLAETQQLAYLAERQALVAQERVHELSARKEVEAGEAERNRILLSARSAEAANAQASAAQAKAESERARNEAASARDEASAQAAVAEQAQKERDTIVDEAARLQAELASLQAQKTDRGMVLTLGDVLFDTAQATLRPGANLTLDRLANFLKENPDFKVLIEGHTDSVGSDDYNLQLSQRRADAVAGALASRSIASDRLRTTGLGERYPVAANDSPGARQQNRRVEIVFSDAKGEFAASAERLSNR